MAGMGDKGEPNGLPVDEWGVRVDENSRPVGSCVARGGATNDAAAVYAATKAIDSLKKYTPPEAQGMTFGEAGPVPAQGNIAQQMFWYTAFTADMVKPGLPVMNEDGTPKWRMAPSPHGAYWSEGTKIGYQDVGSWTLMKTAPRGARQGSLALCAVRDVEDGGREKVGCRSYLHPRIDDQLRTLHRACSKTRRPDRVLLFAGAVAWSPTGTNIPDYPKMAQLWWQIGDAMSGAKTPQEALDSLCQQQEQVLQRLDAPVSKAISDRS